MTALAGCGDSFAEQPADDIVEAANKATTKLKSFHMAGSIPTAGNGELEVDLSLDRDGSCTGSIRLDGSPVRVVRSADRDAFVKFSDDYWRSHFPAARAERVIDAIGDRWVVDKDGQITDAVCVLSKVVDILTSGDRTDGTDTDGTSEVAGLEVVKLRPTDKEESGAVFIATAEPHYVVRVDDGRDTESLSLTFSAFDKEVEVDLPPEDQVTDMESLAAQ